MKTTNICKTNPHKTEARFRSPFMPPGQEIDRANSTASGARTGSK